MGFLGNLANFAVETLQQQNDKVRKYMENYEWRDNSWLEREAIHLRKGSSEDRLAKMTAINNILKQRKGED